MGITHLCENAHFIYKILQYTCFNCICNTCSYVKCVWDMSQYNKLSDIQYARFHMLPVDLTFWNYFGQLVSPPCVWWAETLESRPEGVTNTDDATRRDIKKLDTMETAKTSHLAWQSCTDDIILVKNLKNLCCNISIWHWRLQWRLCVYYLMLKVDTVNNLPLVQQPVILRWQWTIMFVPLEHRWWRLANHRLPKKLYYII